jgi:hypothetical protein
MVYRVPAFLYSRLFGVPPSSASQCGPPPHSLGWGGEGAGGPKSYDWTVTLVLYTILPSRGDLSYFHFD